MEEISFEDFNLEEEEKQRIMETYDKGLLEEVMNQKEKVLKNIYLLEQYGIDFTHALLVSYLPLFLNEEELLREKMDQLIEELGEDYLEQIRKDLSLIGGLI